MLHYLTSVALKLSMACFGLIKGEEHFFGNMSYIRYYKVIVAYALVLEISVCSLGRMCMSSAHRLDLSLVPIIH